MPPVDREYRSRNTHYLRISAHAVLLMNLHMDDHYTEWMNDGILERILVALRDRIPTKLKAEGTNKKGPAGKKSIVEVYRGTDYQIAYYFRKTSQRHAVLLKEKVLDYPEDHKNMHMPPPPPPMMRPPPHQQFNSNKRAREPNPIDVDLTQDNDQDESENAKRLNMGGIDQEPEIVIKDEELDDFPVPSQIRSNQLFHDEEKDDIEEEKDEKPYFDEDDGPKPILKVSYTGYSIFGRTLVVIVEPYPAMNADQRFIRGSLGPQEVRQLSASVQPEASRRRDTASMTPGFKLPSLPLPLFRASPSLTPGPEDQSLRRFREDSQFAIDREEEVSDEELF